MLFRNRTIPRKAPAVDIVTPLIGSLFVRTLRNDLQQRYNVRVFRRTSPKRLYNGAVRAHFSVTRNPLNKIEQFRLFTQLGVSCPRYATTEREARSIDCKVLFARTLVNSTNGRGIIEFERNDVNYPKAPLYTEYIPKKVEYRCHVLNGQVIDVQQKKKKRGFESERNTRIRNVHNGYIYARDGIVLPTGAAELAVQAVQALHYQYGAVDIIYNEKQDKCFVLEVNSRPGLMGTTLEKYTTLIGSLLNLQLK